MTLEKSTLREQVLDYDKTRELWEKVSSFVEAHFRIKPRFEMLKTLFETIDPDLRTALEMSPSDRYNIFENQTKGLENRPSEVHLFRRLRVHCLGR